LRLRHDCEFDKPSSLNTELENNGYSIHRNVLSDNALNLIKSIIETISEEADSSCIRHLRSYSSSFDELLSQPAIKTLIPDNYRPVRSILFDKTPDGNWPVLWHQDLTIALSQRVNVDGYGPWSIKDGVPHVRPPASLLENMITLRLHLDDTPSSNGALRVVPKSHLQGVIPLSDLNEYSKENSITCECLAGDILLMKPLILHSSLKSKEPTRRRVVHIEFAKNGDLASSLSWYEKDLELT